jgi:hypothetical protein
MSLRHRAYRFTGIKGMLNDKACSLLARFLIPELMLGWGEGLDEKGDKNWIRPVRFQFLYYNFP